MGLVYCPATLMNDFCYIFNHCNNLVRKDLVPDSREELQMSVERRCKDSKTGPLDD